MNIHLDQLIVLYRGEQVEEVLSRRSFVLAVVVRKLALEDRIFIEHRVYIPDQKLFVMRDLDVAGLVLLEELLLTLEYLL